jgi:UDPglucose--hexose-1-phosphate uridylyltransferase
MSELRFHPFLDQWVITATHRQERTFHPPPGYCPLCPTKPGGFPTEIPFESYDIVVFENKFPSLSLAPPEPAAEGTEVAPVRRSVGLCEVVCYSDRHDATFATLPYPQIRKLVRVWKERYEALASNPEVEYVFIFENKGKEIGVTLSHPHGQIYAYPYLPPTVRMELAAERAHLDGTGRLLMSDWLEMELHGGPFAPVAEPTMMHVPPSVLVTGELVPEQPIIAIPIESGEAEPEAADQAGRRVVWQNETFAAIVPFFARYPYEVWVAPKVHLPSLRHMTEDQLDQLAEALLVVTRKYDGLFGFSMPYIMSMHQEPAVDGYGFNWFHVEFYPPYRTESKLKYLAGSEAGAGAFINDTLPEDTALRLRDIAVDVG